MRSRPRRWLGAYLVLLLASHATRAVLARREAPLAPGEHVAQVGDASVQDGRAPEIFYRRIDPLTAGAGLDPTPVVLLHGASTSGADLTALGERLAAERPVLLPDLPGFGRSREAGPDSSVCAHAEHVRALLDALGIERADVLGFGMGGAVALCLADRSPERVRSLGLLSAVGVVELELFGDQRLNHLVHAVQRLAFGFLLEGLPHFGLLDRPSLTHARARTSFDTDQRPVRGMLERWQGPLLILHGREDALVPPAAASEHARIVPQSELELVAGGHYEPLRDPAPAAARIEAFLREVDEGRATVRAGAAPERLARAGEPFDPSSVPPFSGASLLILSVSAIFATFISEDVVCLGMGALVAGGRVSFWPATITCLIGITLGDVLIFLAGRTLGRRALGHPPWSWILHEERVAQCSRWFQSRGPVVILTSRLMPGVRMPTYFAAGSLHTRFTLFLGWFIVAGILWTPIVVWGAAKLGDQLMSRLELFERHLLLGVGATLMVGFLLVRGVPLATRRARELLQARREARIQRLPPAPKA